MAGSSVVIAVDPGNCTGVAVYREGFLCEAFAVDPESFPPYTNGVLVLEYPRIYAGAQHTDPNDMVKLAFTAGRIAGLCSKLQRVTVEPRQWKGNAPKAVHQPRIREALSPEERMRLPVLARTKMHNVIDAVGLGLWYLRRLGDGQRVSPG